MLDTSDATDGDPGASATVEPWDIDFCRSCGRPVSAGVTVCFECDAILHSSECVKPNGRWDADQE